MDIDSIIFFSIVTGSVAYVANCFYKNATGKTKTRSAKQTQEYVKKKVAIENKHCGNLPLRDSVGRSNGYYNGSITDKTGKFSKEYAEDMEKLNKEYGMPTAKRKKK